MLQSKPISEAEGSGRCKKAGAGAAGTKTPGGSSFWSGSSRDTIRAIQTRAHAISAVFAKLCRQLGHRSAGGHSPPSPSVASSSSSSSSKLVPLVQGLAHQVHLFLVEYNKCSRLQLDLPGYRQQQQRQDKGRGGSRGEVPEDILHQQRALLQCCDRLKLTASLHQSLSSSQSVMGEAVDTVTQLGAAFTKLIELMLSKEIKSSVEHLNRSRDSELKSSIDAMIGLALEGNHLCRLIAKHGGVRSLLTICVDPKLRRVRVNAFRALGTVCCVLEGIMELEDCGGIEILSDTLRDADSSEDEKSEAAGLLAQVTSPWIENNSGIEGLGRHLSQLVESLTMLSKRTTSAETFLLSSAALANLTFMEPQVTQLMRRHGTARVLVGAVRQQKAISIYIQDQVAAVLANMASSENCRQEVVKHGGLPVLLRFLQAQPPPRPSKPEDFAQMAATERVLQKSAIALSRLCNDRSLAEQVVHLDGLSRLVELCKDDRSRVGSDGVLVACLAAVRKIANACSDGNDDGGDKSAKSSARRALEALDASELVEPRLLDSFLIFSSKNESFV